MKFLAALLILAFSIAAHADDLECKAILKPTSLRSKFADAAALDTFIYGFRQNLAQNFRIRVKTAPIAVSNQETTSLFFQDLLNRGLQIDQAEGSDDLVLTSTADKIFAAITHSAIAEIKQVDVVASTLPPKTLKFATPLIEIDLYDTLLGDPTERILVSIDVTEDRSSKKDLVTLVKYLGFRIRLNEGKSLEISGAPSDLLTLLQNPAVISIKGVQAFQPQNQKQFEIDPVLLIQDVATAVRTVRPIHAMDDENRPANAIVADIDFRRPGMLLLKDNHPREVIPHEETTARDYARYIQHRTDGLRFLYLSEFLGKPIPMFDGALIDMATHRPVANISLKSATTETSHQFKSIADILEFRLSSIFRRLADQMTVNARLNPFEMANLFVRTEPLIRGTLRHKKWLEDVAQMNSIFGALNPPPAIHPPLIIVLDLRLERIRPGEVRKPAVLAKLREMVAKSGIPNLKVELLWNDIDVIEIAANR